LTDFEKNIRIESTDIIRKVFGNYDENIKLLEKTFEVKIVFRDGAIKILGEEKKVNATYQVIEEMINSLHHNNRLNIQNTQYIIEVVKQGMEKEYRNLTDIIAYTVNGRPIKCKTLGQKKYVDAIKNNEVVFGIGPAGTGKTYLAMAMAINAFKNDEVNRIILTRPAVEAGERLGFLPGDLQEKVDPYLRPLYDALHDIMGSETFQKHMERGRIEVAPLAYMRGRTLDDSFIILDEAQNTTPEQMKMFLTRLGFNSKAVITGDITQIDLPGQKTSGLKKVTKILEKVKGIKFIYLTQEDVVRHQLVQRIIKAYEEYDKQRKY
jgi:phosphate starvation-inducible PhoH-like protein